MLHNFSFSSNEQNTKPKETKEDIFLFKSFDSNNNRIEEQEKCDNKNFETFSFMDENEKNSTFFEISKNLPSPLFKKIPYNQIKKIIEKDNIIYKKKNIITLEHYNKINNFLGKKTKREKNEKKNNKNNFFISKSYNYSFNNNKIKKIYGSPIPFIRNNNKNDKNRMKSMYI